MCAYLFKPACQMLHADCHMRASPPDKPLSAGPAVQALRYDEMRRHVETHFRTVLQKHNERMLSEGDGSGQRAAALRSSVSPVGDDVWIEVAGEGGRAGKRPS